MMRVLKVLWVVVILIMVGCGGVSSQKQDSDPNVDKSASVTVSSDEFLKKRNPHIHAPINPDFLIFIKPQAESGERKRLIFIGQKINVPIDICIADALKQKFPNAKIFISDEQNSTEPSTLPIVQITNIRDISVSLGFFIDSHVCKFKTDVTIKNNKTETTTTLKIKGGSGFHLHGNYEDEAIAKACSNFAESLSELIEEQGIKTKAKN